MKNLPGDFVIDRTVRIFYSDKCMGFEPYTWQPLCQASRTPDKFGVELSMGGRLRHHIPGRKIALIKHAWSGSNLFHDWNPRNSPADSASFGQEFKRFVRTVESGMEELRKQGYKPTIRAMVWQQGEGDALQKAGMQNSRRYGHNLNHFIYRVREQFGAADMLFIYGYVIPVPRPRFTGREEVREAQKNIDQGSGYDLSVKGAFVVETDDLPLRSDEPDTPLPDDKVHFNTYGIIELGNRFADKIMENQKVY
jgi:hypothetical protein